MWEVYILYSEKRDRYYTGSTNNLERRVNEHNNRHTPSTRSGIPWRLVYRESYAEKWQARERERAIKKMKSRRYIESLINEDGQDT